MKICLGIKPINIYMNNKKVNINPKIESTELEDLVFRSTTIGMEQMAKAMVRLTLHLMLRNQ